MCLISGVVFSFCLACRFCAFPSFCSFFYSFFIFFFFSFSAWCVIVYERVFPECIYFFFLCSRGPFYFWCSFSFVLLVVIACMLYRVLLALRRVLFSTYVAYPFC